MAILKNIFNTGQKLVSNLINTKLGTPNVTTLPNNPNTTPNVTNLNNTKADTINTALGSNNNTPTATIKPNSNYSETTYTNKDGVSKTGYIINGATYEDPLGKTPIGIGSVVKTNGGYYAKTANGSEKVTPTQYRMPNDTEWKTGYNFNGKTYTDGTLLNPVTNMPLALTTTADNKMYYVDTLGQGKPFNVADYFVDKGLSKALGQDLLPYYERAEKGIQGKSDVARQILENSQKDVNTNYDNLARQQYINYMLGNRDLKNNLQSLGLDRTGVAETTLNSNLNKYQSSLNLNEVERNKAVQGIRDKIAQLEADTGLDIANLWKEYGEKNNSTGLIQLLMNYGQGLKSDEEARALAEKELLRETEDENFGYALKYAIEMEDMSLYKKLIMGKLAGKSTADIMLGNTSVNMGNGSITGALSGGNSNGGGGGDKKPPKKSDDTYTSEKDTTSSVTPKIITPSIIPILENNMYGEKTDRNKINEIEAEIMIAMPSNLNKTQRDSFISDRLISVRNSGKVTNKELQIMYDDLLS